MSGVFVDISAFFAFMNAGDQSHAEAVACMRRLGRSNTDLLTTNLIVAETHALLLSRVSRALALQFLRALDTTTIRVVRVMERDERRARAIIEKYHDKDFSYTDATSFAVMERLHIREAFSLDDDFAQFGFTLIQ